MKSNYYGNNNRKVRQIRQDLRVPVSLLAELIIDGQRIFGKLEDLSLNGSKLRLSGSLPINSKINIKFPNHQLNLQGVCVWSNTQDWAANTSLAGIKFVEVNPEQYAALRQILFSLTG